LATTELERQKAQLAGFFAAPRATLKRISSKCNVENRIEFLFCAWLRFSGAQQKKPPACAGGQCEQKA